MVQQTQKIWTMDDLRNRRDDILAVAKANGAFNVRVFGSVARGDNQATSDLDILVTFQEGSSIFNQVSLWLDLQDLLDCELDLLTDHPDAGRITETARAEAIPL
jgi:uncharacterized protein